MNELYAPLYFLFRTGVLPGRAWQEGGGGSGCDCDGAACGACRVLGLQRCLAHARASLARRKHPDSRARRGCRLRSTPSTNAFLCNSLGDACAPRNRLLQTRTLPAPQNLN